MKQVVSAAKDVVTVLFDACRHRNYTLALGLLFSIVATLWAFGALLAWDTDSMFASGVMLFISASLAQDGIEREKRRG